MKKILLIFSALLPLVLNAQTSDYDVSSYLDEGIKAPNTHHLGDAWLNFLLKADDDFVYNITQATFSSNSTLDWHRHTTNQIIIVVEGAGYYQEKGKKPIIMKKGDVIRCKKDIEHWHTSSKNQDVSYIAIYGNEPTIWTEKLTRAYYDSVADMLKDH
jgi:quercetin dioxygenase-like cupin family protein